MVKRQIIAMGGGGFSMEPDNLALDRYVLRQTNIKRPAICFLPTASGDADSYVLNFYKAFSTLDCQSYLFIPLSPVDCRSGKLSIGAERDLCWWWKYAEYAGVMAGMGCGRYSAQGL